MKKIHKSGFTMIEIMVVIALLGILAGVGINGFADGKARHECELEAGRIRDFLNEGNSQSAKVSQPIPLQIVQTDGSKGPVYSLAASTTNSGVTFWSGIKQGTAQSCSLSNIDSCELLSYPATQQLMRSTNNSTLTLNAPLTSRKDQYLVLRGRKAPYVSSTGDIKETSSDTERMPVIRIKKSRYIALIAPKTGGNIAMYMVKTDNSGAAAAGAKYFTIK